MTLNLFSSSQEGEEILFEAEQGKFCSDRSCSVEQEWGHNKKRQSETLLMPGVGCFVGLDSCLNEEDLPHQDDSSSAIGDAYTEFYDFHPIIVADNMYKIYNVVYGKPSGKKHKSWENDGTLEVSTSGGSVVLKDADNKVIGTKAKVSDVESYASGYETHIGGKSVQIIDEKSGHGKQSSSVSLLKAPAATMLNRDPPSWACSKLSRKYVLSKKSLLKPLHDSSSIDRVPESTGHMPSTVLSPNDRYPGTDFQANDFPPVLGHRHSTPLVEATTSAAIVSKQSTTPSPDNCTLKCSDIDMKNSSISPSVSLDSPPVLLDSPFVSERSEDSIRSTMFGGKRKRPLEDSTADRIQSNQPAGYSDKRTFSVVYGKPSGRKHKSWEHDGTLEIASYEPTATVLLKDALGKVIETKAKVSDVEKYGPGYETHVGGKSVQIIDELLGTTSAQTSISSVDDNSNTFRIETGSKLPWKPAKKSRFSLLQSKPDTNPLVLPRPGVDYQWKHNPSNRPIVDVTVDPFLSRVLKPHQRDGVSFLYSRVCDVASLDMEGAILADEMGLGKTLQCIALVWTLLRQGPYGTPVVKKVLIVAPSSLTSNWHDEFKKWLGLTRIVPYHVDKKNKAEDFVYSRVCPVMIISYDMLTRTYDTLVHTGFDLLICDEGHRLKNGKSKLYELMTNLPIRKRIVLSGTPLQNDLQEFYCLNDFANPGCLGSLREFKKNFEEVILESRNPECSESVRQLGQLRSSQLARRTQGFILRRTSEVQVDSLSTKRETLLVCRATELQGALYERSVQYWTSLTGRNNHLSMTHALRKICNHPGLVQTDDDDDDDSEDLKSVLSQEWSLLSGNVFNTAQSGKLTLVESLLRDLRAKGEEKIVIVSYFTLTLNLFEVLCKEINYAYLRLDGSTSVQNRKSVVDQFNDETSSYFILLLSARAGGAGLNLIGASRLILYDSDWNPATDLQAMARIWRHGQTKPVHIYRLLTAGTVEEKIFQRQISKVDLTQSVIETDFQEASSKMSTEELKDLFTFERDTPSYIHGSLQCSCTGQGEVPSLGTVEEDQDHDSEDEDCFLECFRKKPKDMKKLNNRQHMLMSWGHYLGGEMDKHVLEMVGLPEDVNSSISYMFTQSTA